MPTPTLTLQHGNILIAFILNRLPEHPSSIADFVEECGGLDTLSTITTSQA
jgi:hypothetical protein